MITKTLLLTAILFTYHAYGQSCTTPSVLDWSAQTPGSAGLQSSYNVGSDTIKFDITDPSNSLLPSLPSIIDVYGANANVEYVVSSSLIPLLADSVDIDIQLGTLGTGVSDASFDMLDVDGTKNSGFVRQETYQITGKLNGIDVSPTLTATSQMQLMGNTVFGTEDVSPQLSPLVGLPPNSGVLNVSFNSPVDTINIKFSSILGAGVTPSPTSRPGFAIDDISFCPRLATPLLPPDLQDASDLGASSTDNISSDNTPTFDVACNKVGDVINLYSNLPVANTLIGTTTCTTIGNTAITVTSSMADDMYNITYTEFDGNVESDHSPLLAVTIDTVVLSPTCTTNPNPASDDTAVITTCTGVEASSTLTIPNMICSPTPATVNSTVACTGTVGIGTGKVSVNNDTATVIDIAGNINTSATTGLSIDNSMVSGFVSPKSIPLLNWVALLGLILGILLITRRQISN